MENLISDAWFAMGGGGGGGQPASGKDALIQMLCMFGPLFAIVYVFFLRSKSQQRKEEAKRQAAKRALDEAGRAYESALKELEADNSTEHKKRALESGRKYAALSREAHDGDKSVTLFDEIALTNDINARIK
jgi:hypothetical protein